MDRRRRLHKIDYFGKCLSYFRFQDSLSGSESPISQDSPEQKLMLSSDVLNLSEVSRKNQWRIASRYAKDGLASRVSFTILNLESGLDSRTLQPKWFFSMRGLFKFAFEYMDKQFQQFCVQHLMSWWLECLDSCDLPAEMTLSLEGESDFPMSSEEASPISLRVEGASVLLQNAVGDHQHDHSPESVSNVAIVLHNPAVTSPSSGCKSENKLANEPQHQLWECDDECNVSDGTIDKSTFSCKITSILDDAIDKVLNLRADYEPASIEHCTCDALTTVLTSLTKECCQQTLELGVLLKFLVLILLQYKEGVNRHTDNNRYGLTADQARLLFSVSTWLGKQFNNLTSVMDESVLNFKRTHIGCIDNLPPAEEIVGCVFPECMSVLLYCWLARPQHTNQAPHLEDHSYGIDKQDRAVAPLVQIILEFANHALISGVAHVVYTKVLQSVG